MVRLNQKIGLLNKLELAPTKIESFNSTSHLLLSRWVAKSYQRSTLVNYDSTAICFEFSSQLTTVASSKIVNYDFSIVKTGYLLKV